MRRRPPVPAEVHALVEQMAREDVAESATTGLVNRTLSSP
jgi:hypothetical protein